MSDDGHTYMKTRRQLVIGTSNTQAEKANDIRSPSQEHVVPGRISKVTACCARQHKIVNARRGCHSNLRAVLSALICYSLPVLLRKITTLAYCDAKHTAADTASQAPRMTVGKNATH